MPHKLLSKFWLFTISQISLRKAQKAGICGLSFDEFGRRIGWKLLSTRHPGAFNYIVAPVSILRYFEFPFVWECLPLKPGICMDVSSPQLFSFYVAHNCPESSILMLNPDASDLKSSQEITRKMGWNNIQTKHCGVEALTNQHDQYDCIWTISVIEHISGEYDDNSAILHLYNALKPGGRLIFTIPVDRTFRIEYRDTDCYGTQSKASNGKYFFQRFYDEDSIHERLLKGLPDASVSKQRWFGETSAGRFKAYEEIWMKKGLACAARDAQEIAENYMEFPSWREMPGLGVCGLMLQKKPILSPV